MDDASGARGFDCLVAATVKCLRIERLLWRSDGDVQWRRLDDDEALALRAVESDETFAQMCERMNDLHGDDGALRAASLLKRWLADGLLAADPESTH